MKTKKDIEIAELKSKIESLKREVIAQHQVILKIYKILDDELNK